MASSTPTLDPRTDLFALGNAYLDANDVASVCRVTPETLKNWRYRNYGPPASKGRNPLYRANEVAEFIEARINGTLPNA